ncbi:MAG TPA: hypothetical protein VM870_08385 [Pyrinomonadaceae bacterium]|nr:hypothetical protein [Pyrinomonadaceae bacterium]
MKAKAIFLAIGLTLLTASAAAQDAGGEQKTWRGFLVDARYVSNLLSYESLAQKAKQYTKELGLKREAKESGYGIVVRDKFYAFDAKGNELALELLQQTAKSSRIELEVVGTLPRGGGSTVETTGTAAKPGTLQRDRIGRPTYDQTPGQNSGTYGSSVTLGKRSFGAEKIAVESLKEVAPKEDAPTPAKP